MSRVVAAAKLSRCPRFRRASKPPAFHVTDGDIHIIRQIARHRFLRSSHIAALVGRSVDRTNDRLCRLYHAGYIDRPRAQLDRFPTTGSAPIAYALADRGARLLRARGESGVRSVEWSRKNRGAGRPFIEHQLEIADFQVAMERATAQAGFEVSDIADTKMCVQFAHNGVRRSIGLVPDIAFTLKLESGARRNFFGEIDRGTMPITRADFSQTSIERKLRCYLAAHVARLPERQFGWRAFRVLTVTSDVHRVRSMIEALRSIQPSTAQGSSLFLFIARDELGATNPLAAPWLGADGKPHSLL